MAWRKGQNGSLVFYEDGREPVTFPAGSLSPQTEAMIQLEEENPAGAVALSGAQAAADLGVEPPPMQPVNTIDLNAPPGPVPGAPVNTIDLNAPPSPGEMSRQRMDADTQGKIDALKSVGAAGERGMNALADAAAPVTDFLGLSDPNAREFNKQHPFFDENKNPQQPAAGPAAGLPKPQGEIVPSWAEGAAGKPTKPASGGGASPLAGAFKEQDRAMAAQKNAVDLATEVKAARSTEEAGVLGRLDRQISDHEKNAQIQREAFQTELAGAEKRYADAVDAAAKAKIDPGHYWSSKTTGQKFGLMLAAALTGIGSSLLGKENEMLKKIQADIHTDLQVQRDNIMNAKEGAALKGNVVAQLRSKGLSWEQAMTGAKQVMLEGAKRKLDVLAAEYATPEAEANAEAIKTKIDKEIADMHVARTIAAQKAALTAAAKTHHRLNEGTVSTLGEANAAAKNARSLLDKFEKSHAGGIGGWLMSFVPMTDQKRYEDNARVATQVIGTYLEGGKLSDANVPQYRAMLPAPGDAKETAQNKINAIVELISSRQKQQKSALAGSGYDVSGIADAKKDVGFRAAQ